MRRLALHVEMMPCETLLLCAVKAFLFLETFLFLRLLPREVPFVFIS